MAALIVVVSHLGKWHAGAQGRLEDRLVASGVYSVCIFFVISGFIIARSHRGEFGSLAALKGYGVKRLLRIYPPYWVYSILFLCLGAFRFECFDTSNIVQRTPRELVSAILLIPIVPAPAGFLAVSWSLYYEILFYFVFAAFFVSRKFGFWIAIAFMAISLGNHDQRLIHTFCFNRVNVLFLAGMAMGMVPDKGVFNRIPGLWLIIAGGVLFLLSVTFTVNPNSIAVYLSAILLVAGAVGSDYEKAGAGGNPKTGKQGVAMWLGTISYSVYLCHVPVQAFLFRFVGSPYSHAWVALAYIIAPLLVASLGYVAIEKPCQKLARRLSSRKLRPAEAAVAL